jgi:hypothetical protein
MPERPPTTTTTATLPPPLRTSTPLSRHVLVLHFRDQAFRSVGRSNIAGSCPVFTPSKDVNDRRVAFIESGRIKRLSSPPKSYILRIMTVQVWCPSSDGPDRSALYCQALSFLRFRSWFLSRSGFSSRSPLLHLMPPLSQFVIVVLPFFSHFNSSFCVSLMFGFLNKFIVLYFLEGLLVPELASHLHSQSISF